MRPVHTCRGAMSLAHTYPGWCQQVCIQCMRAVELCVQCMAASRNLSRYAASAWRHVSGAWLRVLSIPPSILYYKGGGWGRGGYNMRVASEAGRARTPS